MAAKQVVIDGSHIQIRDGKQTFIRTDPWLPDSECGFTSTVLSEHVQSALVSSLMVPTIRLRIMTFLMTSLITEIRI